VAALGEFLALFVKAPNPGFNLADKNGEKANSNLGVCQ
jgi:hypothetical protein